MTAAPLLPTVPATGGRRWLDRLCARLGGWCELLRSAHHDRIPF